MLPEYRRQQYFRKIERLLSRILELDELLCKDAAFDETRATEIRKQIRRSQKKVDTIYKALRSENDGET